MVCAWCVHGVCMVWGCTYIVVCVRICGTVLTYVLYQPSFVVMQIRILNQTQIEQDFHYCRKTSCSCGCSCHSDVNVKLFKTWPVVMQVLAVPAPRRVCSALARLRAAPPPGCPSPGYWPWRSTPWPVHRHTHRQTEGQGKHCCSSTSYTYTHIQYV